MASKKNLKKDIAFLTSDLQTSLYIVNVIRRTIEYEKVESVAKKIEEFCSQSLSAISNPNVSLAKPTAKAFSKQGKEALSKAKKDYSKALKAAYKAMRENMMSKFSELAKEVSDLTK